MKITYFSQALLPSDAANSVHVMKFCSALHRNGVDVTLFGRATARALPHNKNFEFYGTTECISLKLSYSPLKLVKTALNVSRALLHIVLFKPDVVYTRSPRFAALSARLGVDTVLEMHRPHDEAHVRRYLSRARRPLLVCITHALRRKLLAHFGCAPEIVIVAPDGADSMGDGVQPAIQSDVNDARLRVGYLGSLNPGKGMEVISHIAAFCPWADFHIVGGNNESVNLWKARTVRASNIRFHGHVPHSVTPQYLKSFDIALLPNQKFVGVSGGGDTNISEWTSPLKAFEYMAAGLPIVASDQENLREVFEHGRNALLCSPENMESWVEALQKLRGAPGLRKELGHNALSDFENGYSWDARAKYLLAEMRRRGMIYCILRDDNGK